MLHPRLPPHARSMPASPWASLHSGASGLPLSHRLSPPSRTSFVARAIIDEDGVTSWRKDELQCLVTKMGGESLLGRRHSRGGGHCRRRKEYHSLHAHTPLSLPLLLPLRKKGGAKSRLHARERERERKLLLLLLTWESDEWERESHGRKRVTNLCCCSTCVEEEKERER
jgi:hypothetical protein